MLNAFPVLAELLARGSASVPASRRYVLGITDWPADCAPCHVRILCAISFGLRGGIRDFTRAALAVWGCGALLGGFMTLFSGLFGGSLPGGDGLDLIFAAAALVLGFGRLLRRRLTRGIAEVTIPYGGRLYRGQALIDTGNLLTDPSSGQPVILMRPSDARELVGELAGSLYLGIIPEQTESGVRAVPIRTAGGTRIGVRLPVRRRSDPARRNGVINGARSVCVDPASEGYGGCGVLLPRAAIII